MMRAKGYLRVTWTAVLLWGLGLCPTSAHGAGFAGGTGEPNDPYRIATAAQLLSIESDPELLARHYVLTASIDLKGKSLSKPVISLFGGDFDGGGYAIRNLRIDQKNRNDLGLFKTILPGAEVRNLDVVDAYVQGLASLGVLASRNEGRVLNCFSSGSVKGEQAGGLIGVNTGIVADCNSIAEVSDGSDIGGLAGINEGTMSRSHSTGSVTGDSGIGGLVGHNLGRIDSCYSIAAMVSQSMDTSAGGLAGHNGGVILFSYANATVACEFSDVGGLVGGNGGTVCCCYSKGSATGGVFVGGLAGCGSGDITSCYSVATVVASTPSRAGGLLGCLIEGDVTDSYFLAPADGGGPDNGIGVPLTAIEMRRQSSFKGWDFWGTDKDGTADPWFMPAEGTPILSWQTQATGLRTVPTVTMLSVEEAWAAIVEAGFAPGTVSYDFHMHTPDGCIIYPVPCSWARPGATIDLVVNSDGLYDWKDNPGDGTADAPYEIQVPAHLGALATHPELWSKRFLLTADLDMRSRLFLTALIAPDTDESTPGFQGTAFSGVFDADGHAIRNLTIHTADGTTDYVGLFGMVGKKGRIYNLDVLHAEIECPGGPDRHVGVLAGSNAGKIFGCSVTGVIRGGNEDGDGLVGENTGTLSGCRADVLRE